MPAALSSASNLLFGGVVKFSEQEGHTCAFVFYNVEITLSLIEDASAS
jgi:hypothetical protein